MIRSRSGGLVAALTFSTLATAWSLAGIQAVFYTYAVAAVLASGVAALFVDKRPDHG